MANKLQGGDLEKFSELAKKTHKDQAVWFLNGLWEKVGKEAENIWKWVHMYNDLDLKKKAEGCELDELNAHVFLEKNNQAVTVKELRDKLREIGWEKRPMMFPILVFLIMRFKADWHYVVNAPQGGNQEEIAKAQKMVDEVQKALEDTLSALEEQKVALSALHKEEEARDTKTKDLTAKSEQGGAVARNKAKAELAAHLAEDPLPLRKAKLTCEAANRRLEKAAKNLEQKLAEAEAYLEQVKQAGGGDSPGAIWWLERELAEKKKYMPKSKQ